MNSPKPVSPSGTRSPPTVKTMRSSSLPVPKGAPTAVRVNREDALKQLLTTMSTVNIRFPKVDNNTGAKEGEKAETGEAPPASVVFRCEKYHETLWSRLNEQRRKESKLCDVVLQYGSQNIHAHRCILACGSKYFNELFENVAETLRTDKLMVSEMNEDALNSLIDFFYTGEISITTENAQKLSTVASVLKSEEVLDGCCDFLIDRMAPINCLSLFRFSQMIHNAKLQKACLEYATRNFEVVIAEEEELQVLDQTEFEKLISSEELDISEDDRLKLILLWVNYNATARNQFAPSLCKLVKITKLSRGYLQRLCMAEEQWRNSGWLNKFLMQALLCQLIPEEPRLLETPKDSDVIVVAGGGLAKNIVECFNLEAQVWTNAEEKSELPSIPNLPRARHGCVAVAVETILYVLGGHTDGATKSVLTYDSASQAWTEGPPMQRPRRWLGATYMNKKIYAIGGNDGSVRLDSCEVLDIDTGKWSFIAPMSFPRSSHGVAAWQNCIYVAGGFTADDVRLSSAESYNPETDVWSRVIKMNSPRCGLGLCVLGDRLYAAGGWSAGGVISDTAEMFSLETNSWTIVAPMNIKRGGLGLVTHDQALYAVGGYDGEQRSDTIEKYDPSTDKWIVLSERMKTPRYNAAVAVFHIKHSD